MERGHHRNIPGVYMRWSYTWYDFRIGVSIKYWGLVLRGWTTYWDIKRSRGFSVATSDKLFCIKNIGGNIFCFVLACSLLIVDCTPRLPILMLGVSSYHIYYNVAHTIYIYISRVDRISTGHSYQSGKLNFLRDSGIRFHCPVSHQPVPSLINLLLSHQPASKSEPH